jgi:alkylation response protein AidB-like acyl-CoA dehydrogenase
MTDDVWLAKARELAPIVAQYRDQSEHERRLSAPVFEAMRERRLFSMMVSKAFGGSAVPLADVVQVIEEVSRQDGAAGWNLVIGAGGALMADYLPEEHAAQTFGIGTVAGSFGANGTAVPVEGGYRVTGRWGFASGCHSATFFAGGSRIVEDGSPRLMASGAPDIQIMIMPASECRIIETWDSTGLRGTGSHDFEAQDVFVPLGRHVSFLGMREPAEARASRAYAASFFAQQGPLLSSVALGIAQDALESFRDLATAKTPRGGSITLAQQNTVQQAYGRAEGLVRSARAFVREVSEQADALTEPTQAQATELSALMRLAGAQAAANATEAVDLMYDWAGTSSVYTSSRIERCFRDVHVVSHHVNVSPVSFEMVGQYMLGGPLAQRR